MPYEIKPLHNRAIVRLEELEKEMASIIVIPDSAQSKPQTARVLAIGPGRFTELGTFQPTVVKPGDLVLVNEYAGYEVHINDETLLVLPEDDIHGIVQSVPEVAATQDCCCLEDVQTCGGTDDAQGA